MPIRLRAAAMIALALCFAAVTFRAQQSQSSEPQLKKEIESFAPFQGKWSCDGVFPSNGKHIASQIAFAPDLDGAWLVKRHDDLSPNLFHAAEYCGYDSAAKHFVAFVYDNFGGVRKFTSSGWTDDRLTWLGEPSKSDPPRLERFVYKRESPAQIQLNWEVKQGASAWAIGDTLTCKKP